MKTDDRRILQTLGDQRDHLRALLDDLEREGEELGTPSDLSEGTGRGSDAVADAIGREVNHAVIDDLRAQLEEVEESLRRLEQGTYGRCERCGQPIDPARLEALPSTRLCFADESNMETIDLMPRRRHRPGPMGAEPLTATMNTRRTP